MASDLTRWRQGARDAAARRAHNAETRDRRRETARESLTRDQRATILQHVREGRSIRAAATALGLSVNRVMLLGRTDDVWRAELDRALLAARDPSVPHGTETGYRRHGCRCPECRIAHRGGRRIRHGTGNRYNNEGCRCAACVAAHRQRIGRFRAERFQQRQIVDGVPVATGSVRHGFASTYVNHGCRCEPCSAAHSAMLRERRDRRKR